jgi:hypothetical protein
MQSLLVRESDERHCPEVAAPMQRPRLLRQRTRATLWWGVATFVVCQAGLRLFIDSCYPEFRDPTFEIKARALQEAIAGSVFPPVCVYMVGSSITGNGFHAKLVEERLCKELDRPCLVFNMSSRNSGPLTDLVWVRRLLDRGIRPNLVLIEFAPFLFNGPTPIDLPRLPYYTLEQGDLDVMERYGQDSDLRRKWRECQWAPSYGHRLTILNCLAPFLVPIADRLHLWAEYDERFWYLQEPRAKEELDRIKREIRTIFEPSLANFTAGAASLQALVELLSLLEKEGIPAAIVMMPQGPTMCGFFHEGAVNELREKVVALGGRHGCRFVDASGWLNEDEFGDYYHPTTAGACIFSNRLAAEFLIPTLTHVPR